MRLSPHRTIVILVESVLMVTSVAAAGESAAQPKTPVPDAQAQQTAKKAAGELFADRFAQVNRTSYPLAVRQSRGQGSNYPDSDRAFVQPILRSCSPSAA